MQEKCIFRKHRDVFYICSILLICSFIGEDIFASLVGWDIFFYSANILVQAVFQAIVNIDFCCFGPGIYLAFVNTDFRSVLFFLRSLLSIHLWDTQEADFLWAHIFLEAEPL